MNKSHPFYKKSKTKTGIKIILIIERIFGMVKIFLLLSFIYAAPFVFRSEHALVLNINQPAALFNSTLVDGGRYTFYIILPQAGKYTSPRLTGAHTPRSGRRSSRHSVSALPRKLRYALGRGWFFGKIQVLYY